MQFVMLAVLFGLVCLAAGQGWGDHGHGGHNHHVDYHAHPKYKFDYGVKDGHTGDKKSQWEERDGHHTKGAYELHEPDGTTRLVEYTSDKHGGFHAHITKHGHYHHPHGGSSYHNFNLFHH